MTSKTSDHDLLIELKTEVVAIRQDIKDLKDGIKTQIEDHEKRIRSLEGRTWIYVGGASAIAFLLVQVISLFQGSFKL